MRLTKIICTLGPSSNTDEGIDALAHAGMNIARINFSHGTREEHLAVLQRIQTWNRTQDPASGRCIGTILDTKGAQIRTGDTDHPIEILKGEEVMFSPEAHGPSSKKTIFVNYSGFANDVRETDRILIDNGDIVFDIVRIEKSGDVLAKARGAGRIGSRRHINLPGADVDLPSVTDQDWNDIAFGIEHNMDFVALSFIRSRDDIETARAFIQKKKGSMEIIAKIETKQAVENIAEIVHAADAIMVARGDLGAELPFEELPVIQDAIVARCREVGKPVIIATHMLESMIAQPTPTRAEVTDIAHAAMTQTDATMLSGETAAGKHPLLALEAMDRVLGATEEHLAAFRINQAEPVQSERQARAEAAFTLAESTNAKAILAFTRTGQTARDLAKFRPRIPIISFTDSDATQRKLTLSYAVAPFLLPLQKDPEATVLQALHHMKQAGYVKTGDRIVIVSDAQAHEQLINTVQLRVV